jgi:hypothetical protein
MVLVVIVYGWDSPGTEGIDASSGTCNTLLVRANRTYWETKPIRSTTCWGLRWLP